MTTDALIDQIKSRGAPKRPDRSAMKAVHDDQLWGMLEELGLLAKLDAGELRCAISDIVLTRENLAGILKTSTGPKLVSATGLVGASIHSTR